MKALDLNFASSPFRNNMPYYLGYGLGTLAVAAFTAYNAYAFMTYSKNQAELETDYARKRTRLEALYEQSGRLQGEITKRDIATLNERAKFTNELLDRRRFSWTALLNSLEEVQPYQVRLMSLRPIIQQKGILIDARAVAKDLQAFWNFQQNLQNHPKFRRVYPAGYLRSDVAGEFIFNIAFNYFPEGVPADVVGLTPEEAASSRIVQAPGDGSSGGGYEDQGAEDEDVEAARPPPSKEVGTKPGFRPPPSGVSAPGQSSVPPGSILRRPVAGDTRGANPGAERAREDLPQPKTPSARPAAAPPETFTVGGFPAPAPGQYPPSATSPVPGTLDRARMRPSRAPLQGTPPPVPPPEDVKRHRLPLDAPPKPGDGDATSKDDHP